MLRKRKQFLRLFAEFENYKSGLQRTFELFKTASQDLVTALLPVLDDFERALAQIKKSERNDQLKGIELIYNKLFDTLQNQGLTEVNEGDGFDAELLRQSPKYHHLKKS